jgi:outer membrane protein assembly factor BamB
MNTSWKLALWGTVLLLLGLSAWLLYLDRSARGRADIINPPEAEALRIAVIDPLASTACWADTGSLARRDYSRLAHHLGHKIRRPVRIDHGRTLPDILRAKPGEIDLIIGKASAMQSQAIQANVSIRPLVRLTDVEGRTDLSGLFVVRKNDPAKTIKDLTDYRILFGPVCDEERHAAALAALAKQNVTPVPPLQMVPSGTAAALAVVAGEADAAVISSYAAPLLDGCDGADKEALRVIGRTAPEPFITVFAAARVTPAAEREIVPALLSIRDNPQLLEAMNSKAGFVDLTARPEKRECRPVRPLAPPWADWRGQERTAISPHVPDRLPSRVNFLWKRGLTGSGLAGIAATHKHVIVADKSKRNDRDIWRCLDAGTGKELWTIAYATPTKMEFTNAPRAAPVIHGSLAYLLGAFGDLHCVDLGDRRILWRRNVVKDFGAELSPWGMSSTPLVVDDELIVNPGAQDASLVALDLHTGEVIWKAPGERAAFASLILGTFGGVRQIVGYDAVSAGGWDPNTGRRLWELPPPKKGDYNVPTPVNVDGRLLLSTANNGTRLYAFGDDGRILPTPVAWNPNLKPDTCTPILMNGLVFGCSDGLLCLDPGESLKTLYATKDDAFKNHVAFIAGNNRVLALSVEGELVLLQASRTELTPISRVRLFKDVEVWSHPALVGNRLYVRSMKEIGCILLGDP